MYYDAVMHTWWCIYVHYRFRCATLHLTRLHAYADIRKGTSLVPDLMGTASSGLQQLCFIDEYQE